MMFWLSLPKKTYLQQLTSVFVAIDILLETAESTYEAVVVSVYFLEDNIH